MTTKKKTQHPKKGKTAPESESNKAYRRKLSRRTRPAAMTVAALIKDDGVPMAVRHWLEMFIEQGDKALVHALPHCGCSKSR
jgi:hypothetical protein